MTPYYQDPFCTIFHGDSRELLESITTVDHLITDPPYGVDVFVRTKDGDGIEALKHGDIGKLNDLYMPVAEFAARHVRRWALIFSDVESCHHWRGVIVAVGLRYVRTGAWVKLGAMPQMTGDRPGVGFEPVTIGHAQGKMRWNGGGHPALWTHKIAKGSGREDHPCPKPLPLMKQLIELFTDPKDLILDPFLGSGTTMRAAKDLGRHCIGVELEEKFCEIAAKRMRQEAFDFE